jgi:futalosine hydrolase
MKILFVAATDFELHQFVENLEKVEGGNPLVTSYKWHDLNIDLLTTGLGMVFTTYSLTKILDGQKYDLVINAGIAGSYID